VFYEAVKGGSRREKGTGARVAEAWGRTKSPPAMLRMLAILNRREDLRAASRAVGMKLALPKRISRGDLYDLVDEACWAFFFGRSTSDASELTPGP
jgi:hypothetical protein